MEGGEKNKTTVLEDLLPEQLVELNLDKTTRFLLEVKTVHFGRPY